MLNMKIESALSKFLNKVVSDRVLHVRWLNTLSFLEHIGSRKLIKSQDSAQLDRVFLQHISEEARHAYYFKKLAYRVAPNDCPTFEERYLISGGASESYFQSVDRKAEENLSKSELDIRLRKRLNYLYTTWMVEERAVMLYRAYNGVLREQNQSFNLNFILQEEDEHLGMVLDLIKKLDLDFKARTKFLFNYENQEFFKLVQVWQDAIKGIKDG